MKEEIETIRILGAPVQVFTAEILASYLGSYLKRGYAGAALHDPCAVACITNPELFSAKPYNVKVETQGKYTAGMSLADLRPYSEAERNVSVNMEVDREGIIKLITEAAGSY
jgi:pyrimidine-specific ribonucleoside hydrolase